MEPVETPSVVAHGCDGDTDCCCSSAANSSVPQFHLNLDLLLPLGAARSAMMQVSLNPGIGKMAEKIAESVAICVG